MSKKIQFIRLPDGKVWRIEEGKIIYGTVRVPEYESLDCLESRLDAISDSATGSFVGLSGFSYSYIGDDLVSFTGSLGELPDDPDDWAEEGCELLTPDSPGLRASLKEQYGLTDIEVDHALATLWNEYGEECVTQKIGSIRQIRTPAHPAECDYVRVLVDGLEIAYWSSDEWADDPMTVMGAIFGAANDSSQ